MYQLYAQLDILVGTTTSLNRYRLPLGGFEFRIIAVRPYSTPVLP